MVSVMTNIFVWKIRLLQKIQIKSVLLSVVYAYGYGGFFINPILDVVFWQITRRFCELKPIYYLSSISFYFFKNSMSFSYFKRIIASSPEEWNLCVHCVHFAVVKDFKASVLYPKENFNNYYCSLLG